MTSDVTFPMKGWRGMMEWVRNLDEKIVVSRNALSLDVPGTHTFLISKFMNIYLVLVSNDAI